jgi:predicted RNA-binding protein YlxR (DUF448 family)
MTQPGYEGIEREFAYQKGICDVCRMPVLADQARCKNQRGAYVHAQCAAAAGDARVGFAGASPPTAPTPEIKEVKGICDVCRVPVLADQARSKNRLGAYVHAQCAAAAGNDWVGFAGVSPPTAPTPELKEVKGICDVCRMPVLADQARCKNQRGAYVHARCAAATGAQVLYGNNIQAAAKVAPRSGHDRVTVQTEFCVISHLTKNRQHVA